jgi:hypothetical protein
VREGVRFLLFKRRTEELKRIGDLPEPVALRVFCFAPSMAALVRACRALSKSTRPGVAQVILYPDPPLRTGAYEAAHALVAAALPGARLVTPATLAATMGAKP